MNVLNVGEQIITFSTTIILSFGVASLLNLVLIKFKRWLVFLLPSLLLILGLVLLVLAIIDQDWGRLGYLLYASIMLILSLGAAISGFLFYFVFTKKVNR